MALLSIPDVAGLSEEVAVSRIRHLQQMGLQRTQLRQYLDGGDQTGESSDAVSDQTKLAGGGGGGGVTLILFLCDVYRRY